MGRPSRRKASAQFRWAALLGIALVVFLSFVPDPSYADGPSRFFRRGSFEPVGIDFGVTTGVSQVARMYITRPFDGNPREVVRRDEGANNFTTLFGLDPRPSNQIQFSDSIAVVPSALGVEVTGGGYQPGDVLVTQGLFVYLIRGNSGPQLLSSGAGIPTILEDNTDCAGTGQANAISTAIVIDRWELQFGGAAIVTCTASGVWEAWAITTSTNSITQVITTNTPVLIARLSFLANGRPDITSPNFKDCGGCIAVVPDSGGTAYFVSGPVPAAHKILADKSVLLDIVSVPLPDPQLPAGRRHALTVPARFRNFGSSGACLFGTVPADNSILQFACNDVAQSLHFAGTGAGDLLVFTSAGSVWLVDGLTLAVSENIHPSTGVYEDLAFSPVKKAVIQVGRTSQDDPNPGGKTGKIKFYILTGLGFTDPLSVIDLSSLRFGATGTEDSNVSCKNVGTDVNGDGFSDPMCEADAEIANCDAPLFCILTGVTDNPSAFEGGD